MEQSLKFSQLSPSRQMLVRLCQALNFGSILNVRIADGEVILDPQPEVLVDVRLDEEVGVRAELELNDFTLRTEICLLLSQISILKNGTIEKIVVHGGLPRRVTFRRRAYQIPS